MLRVASVYINTYMSVRRSVWCGLVNPSTSLINQIKYLSSWPKWPFLCWLAHCWYPHSVCTWATTCGIIFFLIAVRLKHILCLDNAAYVRSAVLLSVGTTTALSHYDESVKDTRSYCSCSLNNLWLCLGKCRLVLVFCTDLIIVSFLPTFSLVIFVCSYNITDFYLRAIFALLLSPG